MKHIRLVWGILMMGMAIYYLCHNEMMYVVYYLGLAIYNEITEVNSKL